MKVNTDKIWFRTIEEIPFLCNFLQTADPAFIINNGSQVLGLQCY